jgi:YD repeat-containing protein
VGYPLVVNTFAKEDAAGNTRWSRQVYDGLGRLIQEQAEKNGNQALLIDRRYDARGQLAWQSVPFEATSQATGNWYVLPTGNGPGATTQYDALGRVIEQVGPDGATTTTGYWGWSSAMVDANGHRRENVSDAFGRLTTVRESTAEPLAYEAEVAPSAHLIGSAQGSVWMSPDVSPSHSGANFLTYGPYKWPFAGSPGQSVRFRLAIDVATGPNDAVAILDVGDPNATGGYQVLAQRTVYRNEFLGGLNSFRDFVLTFDTTGRDYHALEYRVYWLDYAKMAHDKTLLVVPVLQHHPLCLRRAEQPDRCMGCGEQSNPHEL